IIPCDLCGSQEGLQRNAMKAMLDDIERRMPGRKDTMIRALTNVRPSHLLDRKLFDFAGLDASAYEREGVAEARRRVGSVRLLHGRNRWSAVAVKKLAALGNQHHHQTEKSDN